jgi:tetratricopeptide (TPR) repeat protein
MRGNLHYLLADGFDPDTAELALRVGFQPEGGAGPELLRLRLFLGRTGDPLQPLRRELQTHLQMPLPSLWDRGLKVIIHAIEEDLAQPEGRQPSRYSWVQTQILHPTDERRGTLGHPVGGQVDVLWDWAQRLDQQGQRVRAIELLERLLLLAPQHGLALATLVSMLRSQGLVAECLPLYDRLLALRPGDLETRLHQGEALLHLERHREALEVFQGLLRTQGLHPMAHLGAAQARSHGGTDPCPHLDAALELDREATLSVLRETFDYRILVDLPLEPAFQLEDLPALLGVTLGEVQAFVGNHGLPLDADSVRGRELANWVTLQNRYQLLPSPLHWLAPTPRHLPELA